MCLQLRNPQIIVFVANQCINSPCQCEKGSAVAALLQLLQPATLQQLQVLAAKHCHRQPFNSFKQ